MGLFKKKNLDKSDSWSLEKSGLKNHHRSSKNDLAFEKSADQVTRTTVELPASDVQPQINVQRAPRPDMVNNESSKSFAVELDGSTISSLPPSHRDGGSVSGSEPTRGPSTRATSYTSGPPVDRLTQEFFAPDFSEKEAVVSKGLMPTSTQTVSDCTPAPSPRPEADKETYVPTRPESSIFSMATSSPSLMSRVYREYNYYNTSSFKDLVICDPSQKAIFYAEISSHTRSKADVAIREFSGDVNILGAKSMSLNEKDIANTKIVAAADFVPDENAAQIKLSIGDPLDPANNVWVVMKNVVRDLISGVEKFDMPVPGIDGGKGLTFQWIKAGMNDNSENADESSDAKEAYKLVCDNGVVASFRNTSVTNVRKRGSLRIYEGPMVDQYLLLIFLSASAMSEMYRRRRCKKIRRTFLVPF